MTFGKDFFDEISFFLDNLINFTLKFPQNFECNNLKASGSNLPVAIFQFKLLKSLH